MLSNWSVISKSADSARQLLSQWMSECCHPTPTPYPVCVLLSVNQSVSQLIVLTNFSVSKWVSAGTLALPPIQCESFGSQTVGNTTDSGHQLLSQ